MSLLERIVSSTQNVFTASTREDAVQAAISGTGIHPDSVPRVISWPTLQKYINDNGTFVNYNPADQDPDFIWSNVTDSAQMQSFAVASSSYTFSQSTNFDISLVVFADNAHQVQVDLINANTDTIVSSMPLGVLLNDGSMDPITGITVEKLDFPYNWQNIRFYSVSTGTIPAGHYKIIVSFNAENYDQYPGFENPAALAFVADLFAPLAQYAVYNQTQGNFFTTINSAVAAALPNNTLLILPGTIMQSTVVNINKTLSLRGLSGSLVVMTSSATGPFTLTGSNITIENVTMTTDVQRSNWEFILIGGTNNKLINNTIFGPQLPPPMSAWPTTRGITSIISAANNVLIQGNTIYSIRTGMYLNPNTNGNIIDNVIYNTKGGILIDRSTFVIQGNSWGTPPNEVDIVLLAGTAMGAPYDPLSALSANNNNATISNQR